MLLHKGEVLFRQGDIGPLYQLESGMLKIVRLHENGHQMLMNLITPGEVIPHHSLITQQPYHGTAVALTTCEVTLLPAAAWYQSLLDEPGKSVDIALKLQNKLRMMQQRIDQLTHPEPAQRLAKLQGWFEQYLSLPSGQLTDLLTQEEIGQLIGLRRETVNRLLRSSADAVEQKHAQSVPAGPKNS
ncbi:Crp/Fnr family transcriptional regulator [Paenibacillus sp. SYP-B4298]|uniref:Crp/Fnr family transcriptional regulator n=1 Tax=Paenibacillus sp. SYP-B4298 TaxID=2996034 RepID=UPI0022DDC451|nr:Crp/Fnr family transcriptional regulator [Paenibacillus sp. SYP-B4298]